MVFIGFNIGALTVKVAALRGNAQMAKVVNHQGRPIEVLRELLVEPEFNDGDYFGVSGQLGHISEVAAIQRALREVPGNFDAIASLGGESFLVYLVTGGRITCAFAQQVCCGERRIFCAADWTDGTADRGSDTAVVQWQSGAPGVALFGALQVRHHAQTQPQ